MMLDLSLGSLRKGYLNRQFEPIDVITAIHNNIAQHQKYNAWIYRLSNAELAPYLERLAASSPEQLPLYGVPFAIKDNIDLGAIPTTAACETFRYTPQEHAYVVACLINAGAIPIGKTNLDQFATGLVGTRSPFGQGKNVFNPEYISGGSSSGSAIATALGQVSFALGTDTAGSGRVPAVLNNLIGHKPTKGLLSCSGVVPACKTLDCVSIFALTAGDIATLFDVVTKYDRQDPMARKNSYSNSARHYSGKAPGAFTFGVPNKLEFNGNAECESLFNKAVATLTALGGTAKTIDIAPFISAAKLLYEGPWVAERWLATENVDPNAMLPEIKTIIGNGNNASAVDYFRAQYRLAELKVLADEQLMAVDFIVTPTTPTFFKRSEIDLDPLRLNSILGTYTNFMNLLDYCATAIPVGATQCGVHWGVSLFAPAFEDISLLNIASAMQKAFDLPVGATGYALDTGSADSLTQTTPSEKTITVVVCGAHMEGLSLNWQLVERGATLVKKTRSASAYRLYALSDGRRPGMVRESVNGKAIEVEVWAVPAQNFGGFVAAIPAPLGIGKVELIDGSWHSGFICDSYGLKDAKDITDFGGWRAWTATLARKLDSKI